MLILRRSVNGLVVDGGQTHSFLFCDLIPLDNLQEANTETQLPAS